MMATLLGILGIVIIVVLSVVAWRLWKKVWKAEAEIEQKRQDARENELKRLNHIHESVNVIAAALLDDQVRVAEASIRMAVLLDNLPLSCDSKHRFAPIFDVYNRSQHIPTHSKWNELEKKERRKFEHELFALESEFSEKVKEAARYIKENPFGKTHAHEIKH